MKQHTKPVFESYEGAFAASQQNANEYHDWLDQALMDTFPASDPIPLCTID